MSPIYQLGDCQECDGEGAVEACCEEYLPSGECCCAVYGASRLVLQECPACDNDARSASDMTAPDFDRLRKLAEEATPGPWKREENEHGQVCYVVDAAGDFVADTLSADFDADADFIAAFNPATVLPLLAVAEAAARDWRDRFTVDFRDVAALVNEDARRRFTKAELKLAAALSSLAEATGEET